MNQKIRKALLQEFEQILKTALPKIVIDKTEALPSGWRLYKQKWNERATVYLVLCTSEISDEYTVEIAWSEKHQFPSHLGPMNPASVPRCNIGHNEPQESDFRCRIGHLMPLHTDFHWKASRKPGVNDPIDDLLSGDFDLGETPDEEYEDLQLLKENACDAMNKIKEYAIPFLQDSLGEATCLLCC